MSQNNDFAFAVNHNTKGITAWGFQCLFDILGVNAKVRSITKEDNVEYHITITDFTPDELSKFDAQPAPLGVKTEEKTQDVGKIR